LEVLSKGIHSFNPEGEQVTHFKKEAKMKRSIVAVVIAVSVIVFFGLHDGSAQSTPKRGGMVTVAMETDIVSPDPHASANTPTTVVLMHIFESLLGYGENMDFVPILAERWEISMDYKTYTFYLRKGRLFHNGREMVADDVKYSIERIMDPKTASPRGAQLKNIDRIEVIDKYTVRIHMKVTDAGLLAILGYVYPVMAIVPREEVEKQGGSMKNPVGTGPFKFVEWKPDRYVLLERFEQYKPIPGPMNGFGGERIAYLDKVKFVPIPEESVATMALLNKEVDFLDRVPFKKIETFKNEYSKKGIVLPAAEGFDWYHIFVSLNKPVTKDLKFRQAMAYAIDSNVIANAATLGYSTINPSVVTTNNLYYTPFHKKWYKKDVEKAKQLLKESSYKGEEVVILSTKKYQTMYDQSLAVQAELAAVGIKTKIEVLDWPIIIQRLYAGDFQILSMGYGIRPDPALAYVVLNLSGLKDHYPKITEILDKASKTLDLETRKRLFEQAHEVMYEAIPMIEFYNFTIFNAHWNHLKGFKLSGMNFPRFWGVWLEK